MGDKWAISIFLTALIPQERIKLRNPLEYWRMAPLSIVRGKLTLRRGILKNMLRHILFAGTKWYCRRMLPQLWVLCKASWGRDFGSLIIYAVNERRIFTFTHQSVHWRDVLKGVFLRSAFDLGATTPISIISARIFIIVVLALPSLLSL